MTRADLVSEVDRFTSETEELLRSCFAMVDEPSTETRGDRLVTKIRAHLTGRSKQELAELDIYQRFCLDSTETYLAVEQSVFKVTANIDRTPIVRYDYDRLAHSKPSSHIQIHTHRGAVSHLLSQTEHPKPHAIESLHFPTGGARFRPSLEDLLEFLIKDCKFTAKDDWSAAVRKGRERWRRLQARAIVRDAPSEAVAALTNLGYDVKPPSNGVPADSTKALHTW
ncbi:hypothetical protein SacmaDRAFT_5184 [Saccharomonospora marina XMU15]|uniref:Uncharacterized protein n=1 Tax=Saccharomonospora marina XMU15 TaxID=882083 RepID=H5X518_9PSEU|nr:hypothetical protein [Saccharomonospora marina]EHR53350.1 hypothetical protein SacmaDRAFT_5184 [Saccharomonospora marina XMU15]